MILPKGDTPVSLEPYVKAYLPGMPEQKCSGNNQSLQGFSLMNTGVQRFIFSYDQVPIALSHQGMMGAGVWVLITAESISEAYGDAMVFADHLQRWRPLDGHIWVISDIQASDKDVVVFSLE